MQERLSLLSIPFVFICLLATAVFLVGCGSSPTEQPTNDPPTTSMLDCEREGYPCSLADVPSAVLDSSLAALQQAYDALAAGDLDDARRLLEARPDLADIDSNDRAIRFRLEGGTPVWLTDVSGVTPPNAGTRAAVPGAVVGEDTNGDDKVNNRDDKHALVMAPYQWDFVPDERYPDDSRIVESILSSLPAYEGNVRYISNPNEGDQNLVLSDWQTWDQYDAVFVMTHGLRIEHEGRDLVVIYTGIRTDITDHLRTTGAWVGSRYDDDLNRSNAVVEYVLPPDFFRNAYNPGLDNALVVFGACETGSSGANELAGALGDDDFVMMGWTETVFSEDAAIAIGGFAEHLALGIRAEEALLRLQESGGDISVDPKEGTVAVFTHFTSGNDQRLIEVPTMLDDTGQPLVDGVNLSSSLEGIAGDGEADVLTVTTKLAGVEEGTRDLYGVRYELEGSEIGSGYGLRQATRLDPSTVVVEHDVELARDAPAELAELEAIVDLPEGGESRYAAEVDLSGECGWTMTFSGPDHSGVYDGGAVIVQRGPPTTILLSEAPQGVVFPTVTIMLVERLPTNVPATLALGLSGSANPGNQDGVLQISFSDAQYRSGDGSPCCIPTNPEDNYPPPLVMTLDVNDPDRIEGSITGQVWAFSLDGGAPLRKADVLIDFTATGSGDCHISDPQNP